MLPFADGKHDVYGPDALRVICAEFDAAVQSLPQTYNITTGRGGNWPY
jgi:hypothetical protein